MCLGCAEELPIEYGIRNGNGSDSVNGTAAFSQLIVEQGSKVRSTSYLAPKIAEHTDVFVWFVRDFEPPSEEARDWFEEWLKAERNRMLIVVLRDFDAAPLYWKSIRKSAPKEYQPAIEEHEAEALARFALLRNKDKEIDADWFKWLAGAAHRPWNGTKAGDAWCKDVDTSKLETELSRKLVPKSPTVALVGEKDDALVAVRRVRPRNRPARESNPIYIVANGSFLLNLPLVNHEHRKLATRLVEEIGALREVTFLEAGHDPRIHTHDPKDVAHSSLSIMGIEPFDHILLHLCVAGLVFLVASWPIFGRPAPDTAAHASDFGKHIAALGKLLSRQENRGAAEARIATYTDPHTRGGGARRRGRRPSSDLKG
ncbi:MAG: hypothetical protein JSS27_11805 [Planctomycetes bacterium]|nr:hypothetical protein [Planctomycetota bacterium]